MRRKRFPYVLSVSLRSISGSIDLSSCVAPKIVVDLLLVRYDIATDILTPILVLQVQVFYLPIIKKVSTLEALLHVADVLGLRAPDVRSVQVIVILGRESTRTISLKLYLVMTVELVSDQMRRAH